MNISWDLFTDAFLAKISEYEFIKLADADREATVDGFLARSMTSFRKICIFKLTRNDADRLYTTEDGVTIEQDDLDEIIDIVSEGMVVQWLKPYVNHQDLLQNVISTRDYSVYSPAELNRRVRATYDSAMRDHIQMMREYSFNHGDIAGLHI